jgi:cobalamin synthase
MDIVSSSVLAAVYQAVKLCDDGRLGMFCRTGQSAGAKGKSYLATRAQKEKVSQALYACVGVLLYSFLVKSTIGSPALRNAVAVQSTRANGGEMDPCSAKD